MPLRPVSTAAVLLGAIAMLGACASDGESPGALDADTARDRLASSCTVTTAALDALATPSDDAASRAGWTGAVAGELQRQADELAALVVLDAEQRDGVRAFVDNTAAQASAWRELGELLGSGADLDADSRVAELTTEIAELSLGRDDLSDELGVAACRRG